ncbi:hypothetical protein PPERSA_05539 [Pseudocohnilembus persalinus]|uniref:Uncharacterized protein n=1 Tax=Pseudocohnilembus persalinus TaxID=266149 RepID=A0A0V0QT74_PSEPJ|nr:hypothetical protein PPERSA_05539 [Pseudocohnilembus persalinus]|eukprot:KRX05430.1 hypothetical protein PPERSA_05539 [Pseudocohnilembus persalinus]
MDEQEQLKILDSLQKQRENLSYRNNNEIQNSTTTQQENIIKLLKSDNQRKKKLNQEKSSQSKINSDTSVYNVANNFEKLKIKFFQNQFGILNGEKSYNLIGEGSDIQELFETFVI